MPQRCCTTGTALSVASRYLIMFNVADTTVARPPGLRDVKPTPLILITCGSLANIISFALQMHPLLSACSRKHVIEAARQVLRFVSLPNTFSPTTSTSSLFHLPIPLSPSQHTDPHPSLPHTTRHGPRGSGLSWRNAVRDIPEPSPHQARTAG
jgi:hypothetical protein